MIDQARARWGDRLPGGDGEASTLGWFIKQDDATLMELLAFCSASALDAMHGRERASHDDSDALAEAYPAIAPELDGKAPDATNGTGEGLPAGAIAESDGAPADEGESADDEEDAPRA